MEANFPTLFELERDKPNGNAEDQQREFAERFAFRQVNAEAQGRYLLASTIATMASMSISSGGARWANSIGLGAWREPWRLNVSLKTMKDGEFAAVIYDNRQRPHSVNGLPAVRYSDGTEDFYWHGVQVPEFVARAPEDITVTLIEAEDNAEVRRVMIERYGLQKYMQDCGAVRLHKDQTGELYRKNLGPNEEPIVFVKVKNSTPEPDGSIKDYFLRVPPNIRKAKAGVAWTFGMEEKEYETSLET